VKADGNNQRGQYASSVAKNKAFFSENARYAANVGTLPTYRNIRHAIDAAIVGKGRLLDIGNGGVFDYDTGLVGEIVGVDLFLNEALPADLPPNVTLRRGDALALNESDGFYDAVLIVSVLHHLVSADVPGTVKNIGRALAEARRVLAPGGDLIVMESCVPPLAYALERRLFRALRLVASSRFMKHPLTLQLPPAIIEELLRERFERVRVERISVGWLILQFGRRWPTALTPARPYLFIAA
jgi:SAM-dependent methyltransferase